VKSKACPRVELEPQDFAKKLQVLPHFAKAQPTQSVRSSKLAGKANQSTQARVPMSQQFETS
jgi:hypothetical protein